MTEARDQRNYEELEEQYHRDNCRGCDDCVPGWSEMLDPAAPGNAINTDGEE